jgi:general secretion pathway protein J
MSMRSRQRGMTLLELLVVMTLLAMVSALLVQGFSSALALYERMQRRQSEAAPLGLAFHWFADTLAGAQAELDPPRQFHGDATGLSGITHRPLVGAPGQANRFGWRIEQGAAGELQLVYWQEEALAWVVASWPPGSEASFVYRSLQGAPVSRWPDQPEAEDGRVPGAVLLEITPAGAAAPLRWYANLPGRTFPRADYRDF